MRQNVSKLVHTTYHVPSCVQMNDYLCNTCNQLLQRYRMPSCEWFQQTPPKFHFSEPTILLSRDQTLIYFYSMCRLFCVCYWRCVLCVCVIWGVFSVCSTVSAREIFVFTDVHATRYTHQMNRNTHNMTHTYESHDTHLRRWAIRVYRSRTRTCWHTSQQNSKRKNGV